MAVRLGAAEVRCATALGTGADPEAIALGGAPLDAGGTTELVRVAARGWCALQPEIMSASPTPRPTHRTLRWSFTDAATRVVATLGCGAGAR